MSSSLPVKKSIMNTFKQIPKRMGRIYSHPSGLFQNSFISYIFFHHSLLSLSESVYNGLQVHKACLVLVFYRSSSHQGMSRYMDMRTLRTQSAEALPEAPWSSGLSLKEKSGEVSLWCKFGFVSFLLNIIPSQIACKSSLPGFYYFCNSVIN